MKIAITAACLFTPTERIDDPVVLIEDGRIVSLGARRLIELPNAVRRLDFPETVLAPGMIDVHIHGGSGHDVMEADSSALDDMEKHMARQGVTSYLPTTVTAPQDRLLRSLESLCKRTESSRHGGGARPLGIHLEGPFISHAKCGVHPTEHLQKPSPEAFENLWQASGGTIRMLTIAPELPGAIATIERASAAGVCCSVGHSNATYAETIAGISAGALHATHTFNAMRALDHREPGILGAVLSHDQISADIIADGIHVAPAMVKLFIAAKRLERTVLITDAISATGMPDGRYRLGTLEVEVKDGRCDHHGRLAGSVLTLDRALRNVMSFAGCNLQQALRMATLNPAKLLGISKERGTLTAGSIADIVVLTPSGEVVETIVAGVPLSISASA